MLIDMAYQMCGGRGHWIKAVSGIRVPGYPTETAITRFHFSVPITRKRLLEKKNWLTIKPYKFLMTRIKQEKLDFQFRVPGSHNNRKLTALLLDPLAMPLVVTKLQVNQVSKCGALYAGKIFFIYFML